MIAVPVSLLGTFGAFEEINKQAKQLGNVLPGTTQDFINLAKSLKEQGSKTKYSPAAA